jgi:hypothetical protein
MKRCTKIAQLPNTPVRGHGHGRPPTPGHTAHNVPPYTTTPNASNVNSPNHTAREDPQLTPQQRAATHIGDAAVPTLAPDTPEEDGEVLFTHVLTNVMGCDQLLSTILNLDGIHTIHDVLALLIQYGANGLMYIPDGHTEEQDRRTVTIMGDIMKLRQLLLAFNITNLK